jgi:ferredoxin
VQIREIYEEKTRTNVTSPECILCLRCVEMCPEDKCLNAAFLRKPVIRSGFTLFRNAAPLPLTGPRGKSAAQTGRALIALLLLAAGARSAGASSLFISSTHDAKQPAVAAQDRRLALAWVDNRDGNPNVYFRRSADEGASWSPDLRLSVKENAFCFPATLAMDGPNLWASWIDFGTAIDGEICFVRSTDGGATWTREAVLVADANSARAPLLVWNGNTLFLFWQDVQNKVYVKSSPDAG